MPIAMPRRLAPASLPHPLSQPVATSAAQRPRPPRAAEVKFTSTTLHPVTDDGVFEGYASLFDRTDLGHDVVAPGAFRNSLKQRGETGIRMLYQHDPAQPIGVWERIHEDARGLFVRGRLTLDVAKARDVRALMKVGAIDGLSIGFKVLKGRRDNATGLRRLTDVDLWEISIVTFPMLLDARITSIKQRSCDRPRPSAREFERWLVCEAGFTVAEARTVVHVGRPGMPSLDAMKSTATSAPAWQRRLLAQMAEAAALLRPSALRRPGA